MTGSATAPEAVPGGMTVPDNRWDLVADAVTTARLALPPSVALIVPYFEQPRQLQLLYAAVSAHASGVEVVVVDDGSRRPPPPPPAELDATIVRQADLGNRAGAARNRGVRHTDADVLVFVDADTIPAAGCLQALAAWPAVLADALVVGRRRHVDLAAMDDAAAIRWIHAGSASGDVDELAGPGWLADGYAGSGDLRHADDRSYRYVISAVMACRRALFDDVGGFDALQRDYGGEDWDLAARAFNNGAVVVHEPAAVGWHDGPDWAQRSGDTRARNGQTVRLAERITDPHGRGRGVLHRWPETVVVLRGDHDPDAVIAAVTSVLDAVTDVHVHVDRQAPRAAQFFAHDPRVREGPVPADVALRARTVVELHRPATWSTRALRRALDAVRPGGDGRLTIADESGAIAVVTATRAIGRLRRHDRCDDATLQRWFGSRTEDAAIAGLVALEDDVDLARALDRLQSDER